MQHSGQSLNATSPPKRPPKGPPITLHIKDFAHLDNVSLSFGDLTVVVGPQGAGKSLALQWLKIALDGRQIIDALRAAGHPADRSDALIDLIFGTGMATGWHPKSTTVNFGSARITLNNIARRGTGREELFYVPAYRSLLISDGWAAPFQKLNSDTPVVARLFSQNLFDRFSGKDAGTLFPVESGAATTPGAPAARGTRVKMALGRIRHSTLRTNGKGDVAACAKWHHVCWKENNPKASSLNSQDHLLRCSLQTSTT